MSHGPFWRVVWSVNQRPAADLYTNASALARRMAQAISDVHGAQMELIDLLPTAAKAERYAPRRNPTLVHHGYAQGASYHLMSQAGAPLADFYVGKAWATKMAEALASEMGIVLELIQNDDSGTYGRISAAESYRRRPHDGGPITEVGTGLRLPRRNPAGHPVAGEVWKTSSGGRCRVLEVTAGRIRVLHTDSGNREWIDRRDFLASYKPVRPNPKGKGRVPDRVVRAAADIRTASRFGGISAPQVAAIFKKWGIRGAKEKAQVWAGVEAFARIGKNPRAALRWNTYAGGTSAWEGAHSYDARTAFGQYTIDPVTTQYGRRAGYVVRFNIGGPGLTPLPAHMHQPGLYRDLGRAPSPNSAKMLARSHHEAVTAGATPNPKGRKRSNPVGDAFRVGQRVQLHAATDEWMQGDRYGVVVGFGRARDYTDRFAPGGIVKAKPVRVKLDKSGRVRRFHPDNIFAIEGNPSRSSKARASRKTVRSILGRRERRARASGRHDLAAYRMEQSYNRAVARDTANQARRGMQHFDVKSNPAGDRIPIFGGKYLLEEGEPKTYPNLGHVRSFTATGRRGAVYGAMLYADGRFHWLNLSHRGASGSVPFDLAQVSPAHFFGEGLKANPTGHKCKGCGKPYTVCPDCGGEYCRGYWSACPRCKAGSVLPLSRQTPHAWPKANPGGMTYAQAVKKLGADHVAHVVARGDRELGNRMAGAWAANNLEALAAYEAVRIHHFGTGWVSVNPKGRAETSITKIAVRRAAGYPIGQPAPMHMICACGNRLELGARAANVMCDNCGRTWSASGWLIGSNPKGRVSGRMSAAGIEATGDMELVILADGGTTKTVRDQAKRELARRGFKWTADGAVRVGNPRIRKSTRGVMANFDRFDITMPIEAAQDMSGPGAADEAVEHWSKRIVRPASVTPEALAAELKEYGAWDAEQLADDDENWRRILWIGAGNIIQGNPRSLSVPERHQLKIARDTLKMTDVGARIMGGPTKEEARDIIRRLTGREPIENRRKSRSKGPKAVRGTARSNPMDSEVARARRTFRHLNQIEPGTAKRVRGASNAPKVAVQLGELVSFVYESDKYAGTPDNPHGKRLLYEHRTKRPRPILATDPDGREVHIVGGRMHPTPDGLVN